MLLLILIGTPELYRATCEAIMMISSLLRLERLVLNTCPSRFDLPKATVQQSCAIVPSIGFMQAEARSFTRTSHTYLRNKSFKNNNVLPKKFICQPLYSKRKVFLPSLCHRAIQWRLEGLLPVSLVYCLQSHLLR